MEYTAIRFAKEGVEIHYGVAVRQDSHVLPGWRKNYGTAIHSKIN